VSAESAAIVRKLKRIEYDSRKLLPLISEFLTDVDNAPDVFIPYDDGSGESFSRNEVFRESLADLVGKFRRVVDELDEWARAL
jgi:hypothetical protein